MLLMAPNPSSSVKPNTWGPAIWKNEYGYSSFDDFFADAGPLLDGAGVFGISLPTELVARDAWYFPGSGIGAYLMSRFILKGQPDPNGTFFLDQLSQSINTALTSTTENSMPQLVIPNAFQVSIEAITGGRNITNVIGVTNPAGTAAGAAAAVKAAWEATLGPISRLSGLIVMSNYHAVDLSSSSGTIVDVPSTTAGKIVSGNALATRAACALVKWNGSTRNRSSRGRLYYGPIMESDINPDGATLVAGAQTAIDATFTVFANSLSSAGYPLAVLSRKLSTAYPITTHSTETTIATQRRRIRS